MALGNFVMVIVSFAYILVDIYPFSSNTNIRFHSAFAKEDIFIETKRKYKNLQNKIENIKTICGDLCDTNTTRYEAAKDDDSFHYVSLKKEVNCKQIWNESLDCVSEFNQPIQKLPIYLKQYFSHNGMADVKYAYYDEKSSSTTFVKDSFIEWCKRKLNSLRL